MFGKNKKRHSHVTEIIILMYIYIKYELQIPRDMIT